MTSNKTFNDRNLKKRLIKTSSLALGFDDNGYRMFLASKTGKRQLGRMTDEELELLYEAFKGLLLNKSQEQGTHKALLPLHQLMTALYDNKTQKG